MKRHAAVRTTMLASVAFSVLAASPRIDAECIFSNTCYGNEALGSNIDGTYNTAIGNLAMRNNTSGSENTAVGNYALIDNTTGRFNTAVGAQALSTNTTGTYNTAVGYLALEWSDRTIANSAFGGSALQRNTTGKNNTASGFGTLADNKTGNENTASGYFALLKNLDGIENTASGAYALQNNYSGSFNTAMGVNALFSNTSGIYNTAHGQGAMKNNETGSRNVALGYRAGFAVLGSDNIMIGAENAGQAADNGVIRIGSPAKQKKTYVAGIRGVKTGLAAATAVYIDANGQLGTIKSSRRFKEDIREMGEVSERLLSLRPVTFFYSDAFDDGSKPVQFGLIAEEVAEVFPELVVYNEDGSAETVNYHLLSTLILNELQRDRRVIDTQAARIQSLEQQVTDLAALRLQLAQMSERVERLEHERMVAMH